MDPQAADSLYDRYEAIFEGIEPPFAFVDLDALEENSKEMLRRAAGKPIRVASKSIRCREVIDRVAGSDGYEGILAYALPEALMLARAGHRDIVVAYPTADRHAISELAEMTGADPELAITLIVDETRQLDLIEGAVGSGATPIRVAIDIDVSYATMRGQVRIGPKRSPIRTPAQARKLAEEIASRPGLRLDGVLAYEGQVAGVGDAAQGHALRNLGIRRMQAASMAELRERRAAIVAAVSEVGPLRFVNGGGTGSLELTTGRAPSPSSPRAPASTPPPSSTPTAASRSPPPPGSRCRSSAAPTPRSRPRSAAAALASGPAGADPPLPWLPAGLHLDKLEGAGEVQTPLLGEAAVRLKVGNRVYMRHAKAGELCEHFNVLHLIEGDAIVSEAPTYTARATSSSERAPAPALVLRAAPNNPPSNSPSGTTWRRDRQVRPSMPIRGSPGRRKDPRGGPVTREWTTSLFLGDRSARSSVSLAATSSAAGASSPRPAPPPDRAPARCTRWRRRRPGRAARGRRGSRRSAE